MTQIDPELFHTMNATHQLRYALDQASCAANPDTLVAPILAFHAGDHCAQALAQIVRIGCPTSQDYYLKVWARVHRIITGKIRGI